MHKMGHPGYDDDSQYPDDDDRAYYDALPPDDEDMCIDCQRLGSMMDECSCCGACFEMGCGVCKGPHR